MKLVGVPKAKWDEFDDWLADNLGMAERIKIVGGRYTFCTWLRAEVDDADLDLQALVLERFGRGWGYEF